jgi:PLD-like domain
VPELRMVSNSEKDHLEELREMLSQEVKRLIIASPFLAQNIAELLNELPFSGIEAIELITTFKPKDAEQLTKPIMLREFFEYFSEKYPEINVQVHVDNLLHGKIYIAIAQSSRSMIISSANFTRNGLCNNHEWGLVVNDNGVIDDVIADLFESIDYKDVTYTQIKKACMFADQYMRDHPEWVKKPDIYSDILESVYSVEDKGNTNPQYFLKPVGVTDSPILLEDQRDFSNIHENLHFSKKKPKGVRKGDVLITVAVTAGSLLSYYKVTGGLQEVTDDDKGRDAWKERWPWYMEGRNLSPEFGGQWWVHNIQRKDVLEEFFEKYPGVPVTSAGGFSLGTLNYGGDKVKITKEFGDFLISKIKSATSKKNV